MVQFDATRRTLPRLDKQGVRTGNGEEPVRATCSGAAWLSSARAVRCWVKSRNERNPCLQLPSGHAGHSGGTAQENGEEGGDDVKSAWPLCLGLHTCYNDRYKGLQTREGKPIPKNRPQFRLGSAIRPHEGGIASNRGSARRGEYVPGPCTHRPSHHESQLYQKSLKLTRQGGKRPRYGW